ncbi:MAG: hypothetical protein DRJ59_01440 [Thermoprotei archaeon]|nr:MAG: hypothetical protein DRJ59_01440 [Thermoprotei archaeon]
MRSLGNDEKFSRRVKDRDYVETLEGLMFCVVGYLHPPNMYTAYLKYIPSNEGPWERRGVKYSRVLRRYHVLHVKETFKLLRERYPHYIHHCPVRNITMSMVPKKYVKRYYFPEIRLKQLLDEGGRDPLERDAVALCEYLSEASGVPLAKWGVTGSILLGIHNPNFSDIDLTVYGLREAKAVREFLMSSISDKSTPIRRLKNVELKEWCERQAKEFRLVSKDFWSIALRRWNYGYFRGKRYFSIHPIREDSEIKERYGEKKFINMGAIEGTATIADSSESLFLPAVYRVEDVVITKGKQVNDVKELVSYEGVFCDMAEEGEKVRFRGKLEKVVNSSGTEYYRVLVGSTEVGYGYILRTRNPSIKLP